MGKDILITVVTKTDNDHKGRQTTTNQHQTTTNHHKRPQNTSKQPQSTNKQYKLATNEH